MIGSCCESHGEFEPIGVHYFRVILLWIFLLCDRGSRLTNGTFFGVTHSRPSIFDVQKFLAARGTILEHRPHEKKLTQMSKLIIVRKSGHRLQCDQIGRFLRVLIYKFSNKSGPNMWWHCGLFLKHHFLIIKCCGLLLKKVLKT